MVLANDQAAVAPALQGEDAQQVVTVRGDVHGRRILALAPVPHLPGQQVDIVQAQGPVVAHLAAQPGDERPVALLAQPVAAYGRTAGAADIPAAAVHGQGFGKQVGLLLDRRAVGIDAGGQGQGDAHLEAEFHGAPAGRGQLQVELPLQVLVVLALFAVLAGKGGQPVAAGRLETAEIRAAPGVRVEVVVLEVAPEDLAHLLLENGHLVPGGLGGVAQLGQPHLEGGGGHQVARLLALLEIGDGLQVQEQRVRKGGVRGQKRLLRPVGPGLRTVQGPERHRAGAGLRGPVEQGEQVTQVAAAPVPP